ncbi:MAG TPA: ornithine cyclodeaminase family protein [Rhizomicrobium sp.]|nr:ornithine cyclodeaminase family protein [Rhizomicrobium sp.]
MLVLGADQIRTLAPTRRVIEALRKVFGKGGVVAVRTPSQMPGDSPERLFVSMLAMDRDGGPVIKLLTILPENRPKGLLTVQGAIVVFSETGTPQAILDGTVVTHLRTGAASALASEYLSREESSHLVVMGTGAIAPTMAVSHCAVRPIRLVSVWGRTRDKATATAAAIRERVARNVEVVVADKIEHAVASADIVSCSTSSPTPILAGKWLKPGAHVDLIGSFQPTKRESDDDVILRARIFVDTFHGALHEGGDVVEPIARGIIDRSRIEGELGDLVSGRVKGRTSADEITLFKSVGTAIEDLATARMLVEAAGGPAA